MAAQHPHQGGSLARRFLISSLLIALVPLTLVSTFYDILYVRALDAVAESQTNARLAAAENLLRSYLQERQYELLALIDQPAVYDLLSRDEAPRPLGDKAEELFRFQLDNQFVYGVVVRRGDDAPPLWYASDFLRRSVDLDALPVTPLGDSTEVLGPVLPTVEGPGWLILRTRASAGGEGAEDGRPWIGLVLRLTSLTELTNDLTVPGLQTPLLEVPGGVALTPIGTIAAPDGGERAAERGKDVTGEAFLPGWRIRLQWLGDPLLSPLEQARFGLLFLAILAGGAVAWMSRHLSRRLNRQIRPLVEGAERVAKGDFDTPLEVDGSDEIRALALAQERMRLRLKRLVRSIVHVERRAALGQFAAGVAHEIRNPLATIKTTVQALSRKEADPRRRELMDIVGLEIDRASDVVQLLLDYARPRSSEAQPVDLLDLVETVKVLADAIAQDSAVRIECGGGDAVQAWADPAQVRQIVMNLLMNAIQAMEGMGGTVKLRVRRLGLSTYVVVKDTGPGVNAEQLSYLTEPFFTTKSNGTGLGLAICSQLAQANGGTLTFRSVSGWGLTVILRLPLYIPGGTPPPSPPVAPTSKAP